MKKGRANDRSKTAPATIEDGWAAAYGVDMNLLEASLRRTPQERIDFHQAMLNRIQLLRANAKQVFARAAKLGLL